MLINSTEGSRGFGDNCNYDSELSDNGKRVQPHDSHLNPNPRPNKQQKSPNSRNSLLIYFCFRTVNKKSDHSALCITAAVHEVASQQDVQILNLFY